MTLIFKKYFPFLISLAFNVLVDSKFHSTLNNDSASNTIIHGERAGNLKCCLRMFL